jgi:iron complex outermembrane receptor protein
VPLATSVQSSPDFRSEELLAWEAGYRVQPTKSLSFDLALFYNIYDRLRTVEPTPPFFSETPLPHATLPLVARNNMQGETWGVELAADWTPRDWWRLIAAYSYLDSRMDLIDGSRDLYNKSAVEGRSPRHQFSLRSQTDLGENVQLDLWLRYAGRLPALQIGSYVTLDARLAWKPIKTLEISLVAQNLFHNRHPEFTPEFITTVPTQVARQFYGAVTWHF